MIRLIGTFERSGKDETDNTEVTFTVRDNYKHLIKSLNKDELYSIRVDKARNKRTEQQNKYMWTLIGEIDKARNGDRSNDDFNIYIEALTRAGAKFTHLLVEPKEEVRNLLIEQFRAVQFVRRIKVDNKIIDDYKCFYGSSKMDTKEMSNLIDTVLDMASECDIDTTYWKDVFDIE
ncbi:MAG TPA: hypothetical protein IAB27_05375 [Candidatus Coprosoma intestinipullorum]|uniref:Uncharacterized protein n=1 Tax=Candidatus Coprosoma intestinipullorum TaxID=2840752 RepID=A0A9D0ZQZ8_9FIRM|nr:hypothetical protein [Candidatus Coprosoma intestinipullorum]